jgi:hypothetical protein
VPSMNVGYDVEKSTNVKRMHGWTGEWVEREMEMRKKWNKDGQTRRHRGEVRAGVSEADVDAMGSGPEAQGQRNITGQMIAMIRIFGIILRGRSNSGTGMCNVKTYTRDFGYENASGSHSAGVAFRPA